MTDAELRRSFDKPSCFTPFNPSSGHHLQIASFFFGDRISTGNHPQGIKLMIKFPLKFSQDEGDDRWAHLDDRLIRRVLEFFLVCRE